MVVTVADSLELIDQEYVLVPGPPLDMSCSVDISNLGNVPSKSDSPPHVSGNINSTPTAPMPIIGTSASKVGRIESFESHSSAPGTAQGSTDVADMLEQPSADWMRRVRSLKHCASTVKELVNEKVFSYNLVNVKTIQAFLSLMLDLYSY